MLHGIGQALTDQTGTPWEPFDECRRQESLGQARQALGGEQLQRACTRGMTLRFDQAIDLALGGVPPATQPVVPCLPSRHATTTCEL